MFARFDENTAMTLHGRTDGCTDVKTVYPPQTKFAGGIKNMLDPYVVAFTCIWPQFLIWGGGGKKRRELFNINNLFTQQLFSLIKNF